MYNDAFEDHMKLLIVEDEAKTANFLKRGFDEEGFATRIASDGFDALRQIQAGGFDLIVLDIMLPEMDGWSILTFMRGSGLQTPVLALTARDQVPDRVRGLELGADDYLIKPFAFSELLARVRTILRRPPVREPATLRIADLEMDLTAHRAMRAGRRLDLTAREFKLLSMLARHTGEVLTRTLIAQSVWDMSSDGDTNVVDVNVRRLRSKLDEPFEVKLLRTVRGVGYVLEDPQKG
ncbi:MAG TPA: heavy metal response regulator transcription factor [Bryobacteraceae bacterium]|nr:heavy metal response regulator transcription factor [Bryobacteraceae bacterium]